MLEAFVGVKSIKKKGLPRILRLVMLAKGPIFTMRCSVAVKTVQMSHDIIDKRALASSVRAHSKF